MLAGSILQRLQAAHRPGQVGKRPLNFGVYYKNTLVALCHALEDCILTASSPPLVITAFQRGKWYLEEADRYRELAEKSQQVVIMAAPESGFAEHPTSQKANVALVGLGDTDPVAQEWHLMILAPTYSAMVLCQELSAADYGPSGPPTTDLERKFYGFWTFEANLVQEAIELAIDHLGQYDPQLQASLQAQVQAIATAATTAQTDDLGAVVCRVVDYLKDCQQDLHHPLSQYASAIAHQENLDHNLTSNELQAFLRVAQLIDQADVSNPYAAAEVAAIVEMIGQLLDLPAWQINRLRLAALLHRLSSLQGQETELLSQASRDGESAPCCPLVRGAQVLRTMPRLRAIAVIITHLTEQWNGEGQPAHLAADAIPLESRILGLVAAFQARLNRWRTAELEAGQNPFLLALSECQAEQGDRWDPKLVEVLALLVSGLQQGLNLSVTLPKIAAGMWLLDAQTDTLSPEGTPFDVTRLYTTEQVHGS